MEKKDPRKQMSWTFNVSGVNPLGTAHIWDGVWFDDDAFRAVREPRNRYDKFAVALYVGNVKAGYVPQRLSPKIAPLIDEGYVARIKPLGTDYKIGRKRVRDEDGEYYDEPNSYWTAKARLRLISPEEASLAAKRKRKANDASARNATPAPEKKGAGFLASDEAALLADRAPELLTSRQVQVIGLLVQGMSRAEAASALGVKPETVKEHVKGVYRKLRIHSIAELVGCARGWLGGEPDVAQATTTIDEGAAHEASNEESQCDMEKGSSSHSVETDSCEKARDDAWLIDRLSSACLRIIDKRSKGGRLWVVADKRVQPLMEELGKEGFAFQYKEGGGKATRGESAWWLTER